MRSPGRAGRLGWQALAGAIHELAERERRSGGGAGQRRLPRGCRLFESRAANQPLPAPERLCHVVGGALAEAAQPGSGWLPGAAACRHALSVGRQAGELHRKRGHPHPLQAAGNDPRERLEVVVDVDGEAVRGDAARDMDADRGDLALPDPHAGVVWPLVAARTCVDSLFRQRGDERPLERAHVADDILLPNDRVADQLPGAVVGDLPAAIGVAYLDPACAIPLLAHRQLTWTASPPAGVDRRVLKQQHRVRHPPRLARSADALLQLERLPVAHEPEMAHPELIAHARHEPILAPAPRGGSPGQGESTARVPAGAWLWGQARRRSDLLVTADDLIGPASAAV